MADIKKVELAVMEVLYEPEPPHSLASIVDKVGLFGARDVNAALKNLVAQGKVEAVTTNGLSFFSTK